MTKNLKYDIYGNSGQNLVLTKIDIKGRRAASVGWRELNELLEEKIPWYSEFPFLSKHLKLLVFRIPYYIQTSKSPFRAVCLSSWWVPFLFTQKGIQLSLGPTCTWEDAIEGSYHQTFFCFWDNVVSSKRRKLSLNFEKAWAKTRYWMCLFSNYNSINFNV